MAGLTTHVLDTAHGRPASGVRIKLFSQDGSQGEYGFLLETTTNADGRCDKPLLTENTIQTTQYRLDFFVAEYFQSLGIDLPKPAFLDIVPIAFGVADRNAHYHVPLLISPYGYSTYHGS